MRSTPQNNRLIQTLLFVAAFVAIALAFSVARPVSTPGPPARDFEAYYAAGKAWLAHKNPYGVDVWTYERTIPGVDAARRELLPFIGPPHGLPLWGLFAQLPFSIAASVWIAMLIACAAFVWIVAARLCGAHVGARAIVMLVPLAVGFAPLTSAIALGQVALPAFAATLCAIALAESSAIGGALAFFVAALQPNVTLAFAGALRRPQSIRVLAAGLIAAMLAGMLAEGRWGEAGTFVRALRDHGAAERADVIQMTPAAVLAGFGLPMSAATVIAIVLGLTVAAVTVYCIVRSRPDAVFASALVCAAIPLVVPFFHEHDFVVSILPIAYCLFRMRGNAALIGTLSSGVLAVDWLGLAQRPTGLPQSALLAFTFCAGAALQLRERRTQTMIFAVLALLIPVGLAAQLHPAPIWPDALPANFAWPDTNAAHVWEAQQRASGLFEPNAFWASLRTLSLLGSAGLWLALLCHLKYRRSSYYRTA